MSFFTLKLSEENKKIEKFPKFQRQMEKTNIFKCKPPEVHFTECHIINYLLIQLARAVQWNIGPLSFSYGPRCARSVLPRPRANIPQYSHCARLVRGYYLHIYELIIGPHKDLLPVGLMAGLASQRSGFESLFRSELLLLKHIQLIIIIVTKFLHDHHNNNYYS